MGFHRANDAELIESLATRWKYLFESRAVGNGAVDVPRVVLFE
ncbi:hypothetical protein [Nocardia terpenica]